MKPIWIIENFLRSNDVKELISAVEKGGYECHILGADSSKSVDLTCSSIIKPNSSHCVLFYGSIGMARDINRELYSKNCTPVVWNHQDNLRCRKYYSALGAHLFNDRSAFTTFAELNRQKYLFYGVFGKEAVIFVRPDSGDKIFTGGLIDLKEFDRFYTKNKEVIDPDCLVVVSSPKKILGEWRFWVTYEGEIVTQSCYQFHGQRCLVPSAPAGATHKVKEILNEKYYVDPIYCLDICEDADGDFWLLELNSFSSAGVYACDKEKLVEAASSLAEDEWRHDYRQG